MNLAWADIENGVVTNVHAAADWPTGRNVAHLDPRPGPGWLHLGGDNYAPPPEEQGAELEEATSLTPLAFTRLFTLSERVKMQTSDDPIIQDGMLMLQVAQEVKLDDPDTIAFVQYAAYNNYIEPHRVAEILGE